MATPDEVTDAVIATLSQRVTVLEVTVQGLLGVIDTHNETLRVHRLNLANLHDRQQLIERREAKRNADPIIEQEYGRD